MLSHLSWGLCSTGQCQHQAGWNRADVYRLVEPGGCRLHRLVQRCDRCAHGDLTDAATRPLGLRRPALTHAARRCKSVGQQDDRRSRWQQVGSGRVLRAQCGRHCPQCRATGAADGGIYTLGNVPTAGCTTTDATSDVSSAATLATTGGSANGVGSFTATCSGAVDNAGNPGVKAVTYTVNYGGVGGILQPINPDNTSVFKRGQSVPVKFKLGGDEYTGFDDQGAGRSRGFQRRVDASTADDSIVESVTLEYSGDDLPIRLHPARPVHLQRRHEDKNVEQLLDLQGHLGQRSGA